MKRIGGFRRKTRNKLKKNIREHGKISISKYFTKFNIGDRVLLNAEPAVQKGMYFPRFHAKSGLVVAKRGSCYEVKILDNNKQKIVITHPVHLRKL